MSTNSKVHSEFDVQEGISQELYRELSKDELTMDVKAIDQIIAKDYDENTDAACKKMLLQIHHQIDSPKSEKKHMRLLYIAATLFCVAILSTVSFSIAKGWDRDSIFQFFSSLLGLSSFQSNLIEESSISKTEDNVQVEEGTWVQEDENNFVEFTFPDELLNHLPRYQAGLENVLNHFAFVSAQETSDISLTSWLITLENAESIPIYVSILQHHFETPAVFYTYEENNGDQKSLWYNDIKIEYVMNYDVATAQWVDDVYHVSIWGEMSLDSAVDLAKEIIDTKGE